MNIKLVYLCCAVIQLLALHAGLIIGGAVYPGAVVTGAGVTTVFPGTPGVPAAINCPAQSPLQCGVACYSSNQYVCLDSITGFMCPVTAPNRCGNACYSTAQYACTAGGQLCSVGDANCVGVPIGGTSTYEYFLFDGRTCLVAPSIPALNLEADFTIEFRIRPEKTNLILANDEQSIAEKFSAVSFPFSVRLTGANQVFGRILASQRSALGESPAIISQNSLRDGIWHAVAVARRGSFFFIYVDGIITAQVNLATSLYGFGNNAPLTIGCRFLNGLVSTVTGYTNFFRGRLGDLRIWRRGLSDVEIAYNARLLVSATPISIVGAGAYGATVYPAGTVIGAGGVAYKKDGVYPGAEGATIYPAGTVVGGAAYYPGGTVVGGTAVYPAGGSAYQFVNVAGIATYRELVAWYPLLIYSPGVDISANRNDAQLIRV